MRRRWLQTLLGVLIFALLLYKIDVREVLEAFKGVNLLYFGLAAAAYFCYDVLMAFRLHYLLSRLGARNSFKEAFFAHMGGMVASDVTPARSGYLLTPYFLKKDGSAGITEGLAAILAPQGFEFVMKVVGGFLGFLFFVSALDTNLLVPLSVAAVAFLMIGVLTLVILWTREGISSSLLSKIPVLRRFDEKYNRVKDLSLEIKSDLPVIFVIYMACWLLMGLQWFFLAKALDIDLSFVACFLLHPLITLLAFVPLTPAGFGIMEGGTAAVFHMLGINVGVALTFSLLVRINCIVVDAIGLKEVF
ncbi:MAG: putative membrane flippase AglD2/YbhN [Candidatus Alkanophagales archaeon MCA70_species_1]|nr:putative membrane flippase AglD2/YbhN [Candidatus Alkanophaga volatiphilum]